MYAVAKIFPFTGTSLNLFQNYNAVYKASLNETWFSNADPKELELFQQSPDLHPTEYLWEKLEL